MSKIAMFDSQRVNRRKDGSLRARTARSAVSQREPRPSRGGGVSWQWERGQWILVYNGIQAVCCCFFNFCSYSHLFMYLSIYVFTIYNIYMHLIYYIIRYTTYTYQSEYIETSVPQMCTWSMASCCLPMNMIWIMVKPHWCWMNRQH